MTALICLAAVLCSLMPSSGLASDKTSDSVSHPVVETKAEMGNHGMLVLGGRVEAGKIYVSHLPMFEAPHHFQGIWEVTFGEAGDKQYRQAQQAVDRGGKPLHPYFTLRPTDNFLLRDLQETGASFRADIFARHFERSNQQPREILSDVEVTINNQVFFQELGKNLATVKFAEYIVFGTPQERFLAHRIIHAPNYDQIVQIEARNMPETILDGTVILGTHQVDRPTHVLKVGQKVKAQPSRIFTGAASFRAFNFQVLKEYYLEKKELSIDRLSSK